MNEAEKFYRKEFPKVKELTHLDSEIIRLLNLYKKEQIEQLILTDVVKPFYCRDESYHKIDRCKIECDNCKAMKKKYSQ
jgi:hypothetical protein